MKDQCFQFIKGHNNKVSIVGFGSYGQVKLAKNTETGEVVAIKMIQYRNAKEQIDVHHKLNHPNIIRLLNYYYEKQKNTTYMVLEFAQGGTLNEKIKFGIGNLEKIKVKRYFRDICRAVQYLHSLKYMHRDIKPENILLTKDDHAKLCDFGFAAILEYRNTRCGTYEYMAPQMIQQRPYDYKVDNWALGILLFELIQGVAPFRGENGQDVIGQMKKPIVFSNRFEKQEIDLIRMILRVNAEKRPKVSEILQHPFFNDIEEDEPQKQKQQFIPKKFKTYTNPQSSRTTSNESNSIPEDLLKQKNKEGKSVDSQIVKDETQQKQFKPFVPHAKKIFLQKGALTSPTYHSTTNNINQNTTGNIINNNNNNSQYQNHNTSVNLPTGSTSTSVSTSQGNITMFHGSSAGTINSTNVNYKPPTSNIPNLSTSNAYSHGTNKIMGGLISPNSQQSRGGTQNTSGYSGTQLPGYQSPQGNNSSTNYQPGSGLPWRKN